MSTIKYNIIITAPIFKKIILTFICLVIYSISYSQTDTITIKKIFWGHMYEYKGEELSTDGLILLSDGNKQAEINTTNAIICSSANYLFSFVGGFLIGYPIGTGLAEDYSDWRLAAIGCGLLVLSIPFDLLADKYKYMAVNNINNAKKKSFSYHPDLDIQLGLHPSGFSVALKF